MELKDFTEKEQEQINQGLSTAEISDKEAAKKILALVPEEWIKRIPFFVRGHATTKTVERVAKQYPELYAVAKQQGELPDKEREELRQILTDIFQEKMNKHKIYFQPRFGKLGQVSILATFQKKPSSVGICWDR